MDYLRDTREKSFLINDEYLNGYAKLCGINATGVYVSLCRHANKKQTCFPSKRLIAEELSISERSVYTALKKLEEWNIVKVEEQGRKEDGSFRNKIYTLINKDYWKKKLPQANRAVGKKQHSPQANDDTHRRQQVPNKETHIEGNTYKDLQPSGCGDKNSHNKKQQNDSSSFDGQEADKIAPPFRPAEYFKELLKNKQEHVKIVGWYMRAKGMDRIGILPTKQAAEMEMKRNLRVASRIVKMGGLKRAVITAKKIAVKFDAWTLETIEKQINLF